MASLNAKEIMADDMDQIWKLNAIVPDTIKECIHTIVAAEADRKPDKLAIHSWDGKLTYAELDEYSTRLASHLGRVGVHPDSVVPLCFEKSMWTIVAILGVLKAGGAFSLVEPTQPETRLRSIVEQCSASVICASKSSAHLFASLDVEVVIVGNDTLDDWRHDGAVVEADPFRPMYVCFTSGSTGQPKGIVISHSSFCTAFRNQAHQLGFGPESRVFDFISYSFDVSVHNAMTTLAVGATLCIPSEKQRRGSLNETIRDLGATLITLTPTVARLLEPSALPDLKTLILLGEPPIQSDLQRLWDNLAIINAYGPAECTPISTINSTARTAEEVMSIGNGVGVLTWVADPETSSSLIPSGEIGELLLEGPTLANGYLNDTAKTAEAFIRNPPWLLEGCRGYAGREGRLYKTGDLVRRNAAGGLDFMGRKDTQVKIRGQRVELGEVEHHILSSLPSVSQVIVEAIEPDGDREKVMLAAFVLKQEPTEGDAGEDSDRMIDSDLGISAFNVSAETEAALSQRLPVYMMPSTFFTMASVPLTASGKTDRKCLRQFGSRLSAQKLAELQTAAAGEKRQPSTAAEWQLRDLWAQVLNIEARGIGADDSFFRLGGDSIAAMKLVGAARKAGVVLAVTDVFRKPRLAAQAQAQEIVSMSTPEEIRPFSLLGNEADQSTIRKGLSVLCNVKEEVVEDAYPCTQLQEGLMSLNAKRTGDYVFQAVLRLAEGVQLSALRNACSEVVRSTAILRTKIVHHSLFGLVQVICEEGIDWASSDNLAEYLENDKAIPMDLGDALSRFAIVEEPNEKRWLVWTVHHALYDGWSLPLVLDLIGKAYHDHAKPKIPEGRAEFNCFVKHLAGGLENDAKEYWKTYMADGEFGPFPALPASVKEPVATAKLEAEYAIPTNADTEITMSTMIRGAFGILISQYTGGRDVVFGATVSGRNALVPGIEEIIGPTIATVPVRIKTQKDQNVLEYLQAVQQQATEMISYEQTGLQRIAKISPETQTGCEFQTLLVVQAQEDELPAGDVFEAWETIDAQQVLSTYAVTLECFLGAEGVKVRASFDPRVVDSWLMETMLQQFGDILDQLAAHPSANATLADIDTPTMRDEEKIWSWNEPIPDAVERCVHELIDENVQARPEAPAVCAWDGDLSYRDLDDLASQLAGRLSTLGVGPEDIVPICSEKSKWTVVAMLGILKAGGAFVLLDPGLPDSRIQKLCQRVNANTGVTSTSCQKRLSEFTTNTVVVNAEAFQTTIIPRSPQRLSSSKPSDAAYIIFTSGSTGEPKGVIIEHRSYCSAAHNHGKWMNMGQDVRALQFGSYNFAGAIMEQLMTLIYGGCICIPSEEERGTRLVETIQKLDANWAFLTATVLANISPEAVPSLRTVCVGGEPIRAAQIKQWSSKVCLRQTYGSAETSAVVSSALLGEFSATNEVGKATTGRYWIVEPLDHDLLVPVGAPGEIIIEGPTIGRHYIDDPEKSAAAFIPMPSWRAKFGSYTAGSRFYKTGDLGAYQSDGSIRLLGRKDTQIKLRGQRIEVGEIEYQARLATSKVKDVAVELTVIADSARGPELVGFIVLKPTSERITEGELEDMRNEVMRVVQARIETMLPHYMVPSVLVPLQTLPLTVSGKTDRRRLRQMGSALTLEELAKMREAGRRSIRRPTTQAEEQMQKIWAQVLNMDINSIGLDDSFFRLGGDSIAAMKVVGEARKIGIVIAVSDIFRHHKLEDVARCGRGLVDSTVKDIPRTEIRGPVEQSFAQARIWFLDQLYPGLTWYLMPAATRITGPLHLGALGMALSALEERHETLRTTFSSRDGVNLQHVLPFQPRQLKVVDLTAPESESLAQALEREQTTAFNLESEPGWRVAVFRLGREEHILSLVMHHIVSDGWSMDILYRELSEFYSSSVAGREPLSEITRLPIQYRDYSVWQKQQDQADEQQRQLEYWLTQLEGNQPAELLCDKPRPSTLSGEAGIHNLRIEGELYENLQLFCKKLEVTPFVVLLAAFRTTHFRLTGSRDATIGTLNANRSRWELNDMIGFFGNMQCIRVKTDDESFETLVRQVEATATAAFANQDVPFERIVSKLQKGRDISRHPLVQIVFALHAQMDLGELDLEGLETEQMEVTETSRFDLEFHCFQEQSGIRGQILFSTDLYEPLTIKHMVSVFTSVLNESLRDPQTVLESQPLLTANDYQDLQTKGLLAVEDTDYPRESNLPDLFREQAALHPDKIAVKDTTTELTYSELDEKSDRLAERLKSRLMDSETLVGVYANRSCETIVAFLGILKANLAYLPLDTKAPLGRIQTILSSVPGQKLVLTGSNVQISTAEYENVEFANINDMSEGAPIVQSPGSGPSATSLAYIMFTSGSTGKPKGVMIEHRGVIRLVKQGNFVNEMPEGGVMAHMANIAFDVSTWEIYSCLLNGGTLVCIDAMSVLDFRALAAIFSKEQVQAALFTPALFKQYIAECPATISQLRTLILAADRADTQDIFMARRIMKGKIINAYGPTENTGASAYYCLEDGESCSNGVPIGRAISNSGAYVMDSQQRLVPLGVAGELVVTGDGLARGYTDESQNVDRFITVNIAGETVRAYRTGDYVRQRPVDGLLEFFGRIDKQVKVKGHRIEIGEIEFALRNDASVTDAVVVLQRPEGQEAQLHGFVTVSDASEETQEPTEDTEEDHVEQWRGLFESDAYATIDDVDVGRIGRDFIGWTSKYDGSEIPKDEMNEWLDDTMSTLLDNESPGHVLEVGTGSGMILFNLVQGLESYVGLEPSEKAVAFITKTAASIPGLAGKVRMQQGTAADVGKVPSPLSPNLVVINSVAQYFPSREYLLRTVEDLVRLDGVDTIFFGDMRSYPMYKEFQISKAVCLLGDSATRNEIQDKMSEIERVEQELLVDPAFFTALTTQLPDFVEHVEVLPKIMKATNELSCYRYAAVIHVKRQKGNARVISPVAPGEWTDFTAHKLDRNSLGDMLKKPTSGSQIAISNIPYQKTLFERRVVDFLDNDENMEDTASEKGWLLDIRQASRQCASMSAIDLVKLAEEVGWRVEISWGRQRSQHGGMDAIFHRQSSSGGSSRVLFQFPTDYESQPPHLLTSQPLKQKMEHGIADQLLERLRTLLPAYMVPQTIKVLDRMPLNDNGKVDRRALAEVKMARETADEDKTQPRTDAERQLQQIWARVLNIPVASVGIDDSFFKLGGDSITAMQVSSASRASLADISTGDIFRKKTIAEIAKSIVPLSDQSTLDILDKEVVGQPFDLSPIQQLYMQLEPDPTRCFDQTFYLKLRIPATFDAIKGAVEELVSRHAMLRARFRQNADGGWEQYISDDVTSAFTLRESDSDSSGSHEVDALAIQNSRNLLNIETGPLLSAVVFNASGFQSLFLAIHHLVVDLVSWRVLLQDLEELLTNGKVLSAKTISFQAWSTRQAEYAAKELSADTTLQVQPMSEYWGIDPELNVQGETHIKKFALDKQTTSALLGTCNQVFGTRPVELMLSALIHSFISVFSDREPPTIFSEGHGREPWNEKIDVSRTVGWFTTMWPVQISSSTDGNLLDVVRQTKDAVRGLSKNGWSYFTSKFADGSIAKRNASNFPIEVLFNFAGSYQQLERDDSFFTPLVLPEGSDPVSVSKLQRFAIFDFLAQIDHGCLDVMVIYPKGLRNEEGLSTWVDQYQATLKKLTTLLPAKKSEWTLSDFPLAFKSYHDLDAFRDRIMPELAIGEASAIEDIYPCSAIQEGILIAQEKDSSNYRSMFGLEIIASETDNDIEYARIRDAWRAVVRRHSLLRAMLVNGIPGTSRTMHIILKDPTPAMSYIQGQDATEVYNGVPSYTKHGLQHHLSIYQISKKRAYLRLEVNHAIIDGYCSSILLHDFNQAYNNSLDINGPLYGDFIRHVEKQSLEGHATFWKQHLDGVQPCFFPSVESDAQSSGNLELHVPNLDGEKIHSFCTQWEVTAASVLQVAWALVLQVYTGSSAPCIGTLTSGRDIDIHDVGDMFGPLIGMTPCRVRLDGDRSLLEILREVQADYISSMPHQTYPLMEIHRALQVGPPGLFNTAISVQRGMEGPKQSEDGHTIQFRDGHDQTEVGFYHLPP